MTSIKTPLKTSVQTEVSVVFPTFNEAQNILPLIQRTKAALSAYSKEILVVDDDSPDLTWQIAEELKDPEVKVIRRINEKKLASAIQRGIDQSNGKYVLWMDADLSMPPELIPQMLSILKDKDITVGSRYAKGGKDQRPLLRVISSRFINLVTNLVLNFKVLDYDSGFVAARREVLDKIRLSDSGYGEYCIEFLYQAGKKGYSIQEVPFSFIDRRAGQSKTAKTISGLFKFGMLYLKRIFQLRFKSF
ncbi:MAG TPA: polyprenol monophosphomannose synthase [Candidatus Nanoarchaeia archaeon]|nr:polyprenol monophosphomannose synthase [Candidatus Nanoarchaeia archaeon]